MHEETIHDDVLFDRLVDGELSADERRRLLESLDARPDGWRRCALAFLEAQSWRGDLGQLVRGAAQSRIDDATDRSVPHAVRRTPKQVGAWLAIAAGVLIALTLATVRWDDGQKIVSNPPGPDEGAIVTAPPANSANSQPARGDRVDDALTLWARDDTGQPRSLRVPLVDARTLDRQLGVEFRSGLPTDVRAQLHDRGYNVESKRRYAPLWLDNGRPMILPVEDTKIVPLSQPVY
jgi:hypothetical protein